MSSHLALAITYALIATEDSMYKGPRRAAQLACTREIFTAIAPRSVEKLLNTKRTLQLVAQSDGFRYLRECGFYHDADDEFTIETLKRILFLQRVYFSKGCTLTRKTTDYLLSIHSLEAVSMYMEDELFPVEGIVSLLRDHRNESVRASIANTIVIHEQENRGANTRTLIELRRLGADKILFDLINKRSYTDVENLAKYAGAIGSLCLSASKELLQAGNLPRSVLNNEALMKEIIAGREEWTKGLTSEYVFEYILPTFHFLSRCGDSAHVRGAASLMLGSCTARAEYASICEEVFTETFVKEELAPILTKLLPDSPTETLQRQHAAMGMRSWSEMRETVYSSSSSKMMMMGNQESSADQQYSPSPSMNNNVENDDQEEETSEKRENDTNDQKIVSSVPSVEEQDFAKKLREKQQELSYFSWVLQNFSHSDVSREMLFSETVLKLLTKFLKVYPKPPSAVRKMKSQQSNCERNNDDDDTVESVKQQGIDQEAEEEDEDDQYSEDFLTKEDTSYTFGKQAPDRADDAAYNYTIEARHRIADAIRFTISRERSIRLANIQTATLMATNNNNINTSNNNSNGARQERSALAKITMTLVSHGVIGALLENIAASPANFRSHETYLELVCCVGRFIPQVFLEGRDDTQLTLEETSCCDMLLKETNFLGVFIDFLILGGKYWNRLIYDNDFVKKHYTTREEKKSPFSSSSNDLAYTYIVHEEKDDDASIDAYDLDDENLDSKISDARRKIIKQKAHISALKESLALAMAVSYQVVGALVQYFQKRCSKDDNNNTTENDDEKNKSAESSAAATSSSSLPPFSQEESKDIWKRNHMFQLRQLALLLRAPEDDDRKDDLLDRIISGARSGLSSLGVLKNATIVKKKPEPTADDMKNICSFFWNKMLFDIAHNGQVLSGLERVIIRTRIAACKVLAAFLDEIDEKYTEEELQKHFPSLTQM